MGTSQSRQSFGAPLSWERRSIQQGNTTMEAWLVAIIVVGSLSIVVSIVFMLLRYTKSRRMQAINGFYPVEQKIPRDWGVAKGSTEKRRIAEDVERNMIIRKSLATRPSSAVFPNQESPVADRTSRAEREGERSMGSRLQDDQSDDESEAGVKDDWKAWEARVRTERRMSNLDIIGLDQHPAFAPNQLHGTSQADESRMV